MNANVVVAVTTLIGTALGGIISAVTAAIVNKSNVKKHGIENMLDQLGAYHILESKYIEEISNLRKKLNEKTGANLHDSPVTIQREIRKIALGESGIVIDYTKSKADKNKQELNRL